MLTAYITVRLCTSEDSAPTEPCLIARGASMNDLALAASTITMEAIMGSRAPKPGRPRSIVRYVDDDQTFANPNASERRLDSATVGSSIDAVGGSV